MKAASSPSDAWSARKSELTRKKVDQDKKPTGHWGQVVNWKSNFESKTYTDIPKT